MNQRLFLALVLSALVLFGMPLLFPGAKRAPAGARGAAGDTARPPVTATTPGAQQPAAGATAAIASPAVPAAAPATAGAVATPAETTTVDAGRATYRLAGAEPVAVTLHDFRSLRPNGSGSVELLRAGDALARYALELEGKVIPLASVPMQATRTSGPGGAPVVTYTGAVNGHALTITNRFATDSAGQYQVRVSGMVEGAPQGARLLVELPRGLRSHEADTLDDARHLAFGYKPTKRDVESVRFASLDSGLTRVDTGSFKWVSVRSKYFLTGVVADGTTPAFRELRMTPAPRVAKGVVHDARGVAALPLSNGRFELTLVAGPQKARFLRALGNDFENVNPYGGWLHAAVQPFAAIVTNILLWLKDTTRLNYGWVLIIFGVLVRLLLWPLNQTAMRSSIKMQRLQPELAEIQKKYGRDPEKQRTELMKVYQAHGMSPFSPMLGCLPMLLPMPVLFALYHVFQNTVEFRGVSFWWLADISLKDPLYVIPVFMGLTMFALSWLGMRGVPPNPQTKMMSYMMPVMMTAIFLNFPSGLNLYYAVQNVAAMPQQWLLSRERERAGIGAPAPTKGGGGGGGTAKVARR